MGIAVAWSAAQLSTAVRSKQVFDKRSKNKDETMKSQERRSSSGQPEAPVSKKKSGARLTTRKRRGAGRKQVDSNDAVVLEVTPARRPDAATPVAVGSLIDGERFEFRTKRIWSLLDIDAALGFEGNADIAGRGGLCGILEAYWGQRRRSGEATRGPENAQSELRALWISLQAHRSTDYVNASNEEHCQRVFIALGRLVPHLVYARDSRKSLEQLFQSETVRSLVEQLEDRYLCIVV